MNLLALAILAGAAAPEPEPTRILVAYHSETGNTEQLAAAVRQGASGVQGVEVRLRKASEASAEDFRWADGILLGSPVEWAGLAAEAKRLVDRVGAELLREGAAAGEGRTAGAFVTGGAVASGKELARLSILAAFLNLRFIVIGGVAADGFGTLGASATTGPDDPGLSEAELEEGRRFGERFARLTRQIRSGAGK